MGWGFGSQGGSLVVEVTGCGLGCVVWPWPPVTPLSLL